MSPEGAGEQVPQAPTHCPWVCSVRFAEVEAGKKEEEEENPLLIALEEKTVVQEEQAGLWFSKVGRGLGAQTDKDFVGDRWLSLPLSQDGFSGIEDDADEALEIQQAQLLFESRRKGRQQGPTPPPGLKTEKKPPQHQEEDPKGPEALAAAKTAPGPGEEGDGSSDSDSSSSSSDEERQVAAAVLTFSPCSGFPPLVVDTF